MKDFIKSAIVHKGALTAKAKKAGMTPHAFAVTHQHTPGITGKQSRLAMTLWNFHNKGRS